MLLLVGSQLVLIIANPFKGFQDAFETQDVLGGNALVAAARARLLAPALLQCVLYRVDLSVDGPFCHGYWAEPDFLAWQRICPPLVREKSLAPHRFGPGALTAAEGAMV